MFGKVFRFLAMGVAMVYFTMPLFVKGEERLWFLIIYIPNAALFLYFTYDLVKEIVKRRKQRKIHGNAMEVRDV